VSEAARILAPTLVAVLALAAAAKLRRGREFERTVASFELARGRGAVRAVALAVPAIELAAASILAAGAVRVGALVAAAFVAAATAVALRARARNPGARCGCLSLSDPGGVGRWYLARNGALLALASYVAVLSDGPLRASGPAVLTALSLTLALLLGESVAHVGSGVPMSRVREA